jgi:hypothetical protein
MARPSELEHNLQVLTSTKLLNLEVSLAAIVHGGALADLDPWDVFCGNGWIVRRRGPIGPRLDIEEVRDAVRDELRSAGLLKG